MIFTPMKKTKRTDVLDLSTTLSKISRRINTQTQNHSVLFSSPSSKSTERNKFVKKLSISVNKKRLQSPTARKQSPRLNHSLKYKVNIQTKQSSQSHNSIMAYGISCFKGFRNVVNPHHIGVNLGYIKNFTLVESYDGFFAGSYVKKQYPIKLMSIASQNIKRKPQLYLQRVNEQVQEGLRKRQIFEKDNSGCTLTSVIIDNEFITVSNCGASQVICVTKSGSMLKLSQQHDTKNPQELDRIIRNGGSIYKTVVNVPYQKDLSVEGPLRLAPSGLCYTRTLGRGLDYENQCKNDNFGQKVTWKPHITYIKTQQTKWIGIFSQSVIDVLNKNWIQQLVDNSLKGRTQSYTEHHIAGQVSKRIVNEAIGQGLPDAVTAIIIIVGKYQIPYRTHVTQFQQEIAKPKEVKKIKSLKYIGNRRSFVKRSPQRK